MTECVYCGNDLVGEELDNPYIDPDGDTICDDCHCEHFEFTCDICKEYGDVEDQHKMLVVWDDLETGVPVGLYKVKSFPYYVSDYFSAWIIPDAIEWIDNIPSQDSSGYPCGHLCGACQALYVEMYSGLKGMNT